jgi:hypothetical protein
VAATNYDPNSEQAEVLARRKPMFELLVDWARQALNT